MFTGIVTDVGVVGRAVQVGPDLELAIACGYEALEPGESIAVDGSCLTVHAAEPDGFTVRVIPTSLERTKFGAMAPGTRVNLERALRVGDRLGGHLVQGHVDGVGRVEQVTRRDGSHLVDITVPEAVAQVTIPLGSITVDGVSLTVNAIPHPGAVQVALVPFTLQQTTLGERRAGDAVHLEGDTIGKYVRAFIQP